MPLRPTKSTTKFHKSRYRKHAPMKHHATIAGAVSWVHSSSMHSEELGGRIKMSSEQHISMPSHVNCIGVLICRPFPSSFRSPSSTPVTPSAKMCKPWKLSSVKRLSHRTISSTWNSWRSLRRTSSRRYVPLIHMQIVCCCSQSSPNEFEHCPFFCCTHRAPTRTARSSSHWRSAGNCCVSSPRKCWSESQHRFWPNTIHETRAIKLVAPSVMDSHNTPTFIQQR